MEAELKDYEVVTGNEERNSNATPIRNSGALDKDDWEKQIDELLANEDDEDLKWAERFFAMDRIVAISSRFEIILR